MTAANAKKLVETILSSKLTDSQHVEQVMSKNEALSREKYDLKNKFIESERNQLILEYLGKDMSTWPTLPEKEADYKSSRQARKSIKKIYEELKDNISKVIQDIGEEYKQLQEKTKLLEEKLVVYENKKETFMSKQNIDPETVHSAVQTCQRAVDKINAELTKQKELKIQLEASISYLKEQQQQYKVSHVQNAVNKRSQKIVNFLEKMTGVKVKGTTQNTVTVEFQERCPMEIDMNSSMADLNLTLTLHVNKDHHGNSRLSDVKVNSDHFNIKDIVDDAIFNNDVPFLIRKVENRWRQKFPMLSEIEMLNKHHAIDWIQSQCRLRVLVGNCGRIMFTLAYPEDYPHSRNITLVDTYGIDMVDVNNLPGDGASLMDWVKHLEDVYGDKS